MLLLRLQQLRTGRIRNNPPGLRDTASSRFLAITYLTGRAELKCKKNVIEKFVYHETVV